MQEDTLVEDSNSIDSQASIQSQNNEGESSEQSFAGVEVPVDVELDATQNELSLGKASPTGSLRINSVQLLNSELL